MRIYLAGAYVARDTLRRHVVPLVNARHSVCASWLNERHDITTGTVGPALAQPAEYISHHTNKDLDEICEAGAVLLLTESYQRELPGMHLVQSALFTTGGRHVETGYALARRVPVVTVGQPENVFQRSFTTIVPTLDAALDVLDEIGSRRGL